jgi:hypothetical protein
MMLACRFLLLLAAPAALLTGASRDVSPTQFDKSNPLASIRRLQHSTAPADRKVVRQIENGPRDLHRELAAARREGIPLTPQDLQIRPPSPSLDAAPIYTRLIPLLRQKPLDPRIEGLIADLGRPTASAEEIADLQRMLTERRDAMDLLHQAADRPSCFFRRDWTQGPGVVFPEQSFLRKAARLLWAESDLLARQGRYQEAIANQARGFRVAQHAASDPVVTAFLVGIACEDLALDGMRNILYLAGDKPGIAEAIREAMATRRPHLSFQYALRGEVVMGRVGLNWLRWSGKTGLIELYSDSWESLPHLPTSTQDQRLLNSVCDAADAQFLGWMRHAFQIAGKPAPERLRLFRRQLEAQILYYTSDGQNPVRSIVGALTSSPERMATVGVLAEAREQVLLAGAMALAYRAQRGTYPDNLGSRGEPEPTDPFTGKPLEYRRERNGFVVSSRGPVGEDRDARTAALMRERLTFTEAEQRTYARAARRAADRMRERLTFRYPPVRSGT